MSQEHAERPKNMQKDLKSYLEGDLWSTWHIYSTTYSEFDAWSVFWQGP